MALFVVQPEARAEDLAPDDPLAGFETIEQAPTEPEMLTVFVPKFALKRGETVSAAVVEEVDLPAKQVRTENLLSLDDIIGKETTRGLRAGEPFSLKKLRAPILVKRNQKVRMLYEKNGLYLVTEGRVLADAGAGERVKVMNEDAKKVVTGVVTQEGDVRVGI